LTSKGITTVVAEWAKLKSGEIADFAIAQTNLDALNDLVSCGGDKWALTNSVCTSCKSIKDTAAFTPPSCSSNATQA